MTDTASEKQALRQEMRRRRRAFAQNLPTSVSSLVFSRPPRPLSDALARRLTPGAAIGLYWPVAGEPRTIGYARHFLEAGHVLALPWSDDRAAPMRFRAWGGEASELEIGPFGIAQPGADLPEVRPEALFVPLVAFDTALNRLGQGGGHYDRYLEANPGLVRIGMAWSVQLADRLPLEPHDRPLHYVVTEAQLFEKPDMSDA